MSVLFIAGARTPTQPIIQATAVSTSAISVALTLPSVEPTTGIAFYRLYRAVGSGSLSQIAQLLPSQFPYIDSAVTAGTAYRYRTVAVNNALNQDSSAPSVLTSAMIMSTVTAPASSNKVKFHPGHYMLTGTLQAGGTSQTQWYPTLAANRTNVQGFIANYRWGNFETSVQGQYDFSQIVDDINALQEVFPGARFGIQMGTGFYATLSTTKVVTTTNFGVPLYILNCGGKLTVSGGGRQFTNFPVAVSANGQQYGFSLGNAAAANPVATGNYGQYWCNRWNPAVNQCLINMGVALANTPLTLSAGPYAGQTYTFNTHPLFELYGDLDEFSIGFTNPSEPSDYNYQTEQAEYGQWYTQLAAAWSNTIVHTFLTYGNSNNGRNNTPTTQLANLLALAYQAGVAYSSPDIVAPFLLSSSIDGGHTSAAFNLFSGCSTNDLTFPYTWQQGPGLTYGGIDYRNRMISIGTIQGDDYDRCVINGSGVKSPNAAVMQAIYDVAITNSCATHMLWSVIDDNGNVWAPTVYPFISNPSNPTIQTVPSTLAGRVITN